MENFAKLFNLPNGAQVLLMQEYEEETELHVVKQITCMQGVMIKVNPGFKEEESANLYLEQFGEENAQEFYNNIIEMLNQN